MKTIFTILFFVLTVYSFAQTTPTLVHYDGAVALTKAEKINDVFNAVGTKYYQQTGDKDRAINIAVCLYYALDLSRSKTDAKDFWDSWAQSNTWPYPYGLTITVTTNERIQIINALNQEIESAIDLEVLRWQTLKKE